MWVANITVINNSVPGDPQSPFVTSCRRLGTPAITTRGFDEAQTRTLAGWSCEVMDHPEDEQTLARVREQVLTLCRRLPVYAQA